MTSGNCIVSGSCNISSFGNNCDNICHCTKPGCDRFTGLCNVAGCDVGWTGSACDQGVNINSKDNSMKSGSDALVGYILFGSLLFISIGFNIGFIIDRLRTKRKKSERAQSDSEMHYQYTVNVNENYEILDTSKIERTKNIYDTVDKKCG
ncbi:multiple epidermal growth factor-like domains protein 10 [Mizuhopecten yessoensis]|uniref:multiple epidermal growth factor-like domains protein 10 n=1 Tax=Mizuhopecten yessoensis TaxID=6573 RepID=UPI000B45E761|nr:multiple epidermal growth factor-like domains protein 10 [Mizuhopecten yessoensis]